MTSSVALAVNLTLFEGLKFALWLRPHFDVCEPKNRPGLCHFLILVPKNAIWHWSQKVADGLGADSALRASFGAKKDSSIISYFLGLVTKQYILASEDLKYFILFEDAHARDFCCCCMDQ